MNWIIIFLKTDCTPLKKKKKEKGKFKYLSPGVKFFWFLLVLLTFVGVLLQPQKSIKQWDKEINTVFGILNIGKKLGDMSIIHKEAKAELRVSALFMSELV